MRHSRLSPGNVIVFAWLVAATSCDGTDSVVEPQGPPQRSNLVVESSIPDQDATLTNPAKYASDLPGRTADVMVSQVISDTAAHQVTVRLNLRLGEVVSVQHYFLPSPWDYDSVDASCEGTACGGVVDVDLQGRLLTLSGVTLSGDDPSHTTTLNGTIGW